MKQNSVKLIYAFVLCAFISCKGVSEEQVIGNYYLVAMDYVKEETSLSYKLEDGNSVGVVDKTVFAVGFNDNYIIVKQHPSNNRTITNYYIVPIYKESTLSPEKGLIGPLTLEQFNEKRKELNISDKVTFTKEIEDLK